MALKISNLEQIADKFARKQYVFNDLHLDFSTNANFNSFEQQTVKGNDIAIDYDLAAIYNSLRNIFYTKPGQRFLFPSYGLDLNQFLFEPITPINATSIGERIVRSIDLFEKRVEVLECNVATNEEDNTYEITIHIKVPLYDTEATMTALLDKKTQSVFVLETSRTR